MGRESCQAKARPFGGEIGSILKNTRFGTGLRSQTRGKQGPMIWFKTLRLMLCGEGLVGGGGGESARFLPD